MLESDDARLYEREPALMDTLKLSFEVFAQRNFQSREHFSKLSLAVYDPETMPGARWVVDQIQEAINDARPKAGSAGYGAREIEQM